MSIGDVNSDARGSGARFNDGKLQMDLIPVSFWVASWGEDLASDGHAWLASCLDALSAFQMGDDEAVGSVLASMPGHFLEGAAAVFVFGANKYTLRNDCTCAGGEKAKQYRAEVMHEINAKNMRSSANTLESFDNMDGREKNMTRWLQAAAASVGDSKDPMLTTAILQGSCEEFFAIPAISALGLLSGLTDGLSEHQYTCGVHKVVASGAWNWAKGMAWSVPTGCILRHAKAIMEGDEVDDESGRSHLDHVVCNLIMLAWFVDHYPEGDDRPPVSKPIVSLLVASDIAPGLDPNIINPVAGR